MRGAVGLRFDQNVIRDLLIEGDAPDPWSVLRRSYTGPWFFVHAALLVLYVLPYVGRVLALTAAGQTWATLGPRVPDLITIEVAHVAAWRVLIGLERGWWVPVLGAVLFAYNLLRGYLTLRIGMLRDAEERSGVSPAIKDYMGTQGHMDEKGWRLIGPLGRQTWKFTQSMSRFWASHSENKDHETVRLASIGYWRMHRMMQLLMWIAIASFVAHALVWITTTELPHVQVRDAAE